MVHNERFGTYMSRKKAEESSFEPEVVVLHCQHCISRGADTALEAERASGISVKVVMVPCSSKIEVPYILKILERGADAVEVVACPVSKCRFLVGSSRAEKRVKYVGRLLDQIHIGARRVGISRGLGLSAKKLIGLAAGRAETARVLGPNPMKKGDSR